MLHPELDNQWNHSAGWRVAIMGGAYGNVPALRACMDDAQAQGCQEMAFIGDAIGCCGHSAEILTLIQRHFTLLVAGNHEQQVAAGQATCDCGYASPEDEQTGCRALAMALDGITPDHRNWLQTWPAELILPTPAGPVLLCHGSPVRTNEFLYESEFSRARWQQFLESRNLIGFVCTHTGLPWLQRVSNTNFAVNCGVVGKPDHDGDTAVHYSILKVSAYGAVEVSIRAVHYDVANWAGQLRREGVPAIFIEPLETGIWTTGLASLPPAERPVHVGPRRTELTIRTRRGPLPVYRKNLA